MILHLIVNKEFSKRFVRVIGLVHSRGRFRSSDLWVMGPARFRCATLLEIGYTLSILCSEISAIRSEILLSIQVCNTFVNYDIFNESGHPKFMRKCQLQNFSENFNVIYHETSISK